MWRRVVILQDPVFREIGSALLNKMLKKPTVNYPGHIDLDVKPILSRVCLPWQLSFVYDLVLDLVERSLYLGTWTTNVLQ